MAQCLISIAIWPDSPRSPLPSPKLVARASGDPKNAQDTDPGRDMQALGLSEIPGSQEVSI